MTSLLHFNPMVGWFDLPGRENEDSPAPGGSQDKGLTGLGLTKYLNSEGRGFYLFGGVGAAILQVLAAYGDSEVGFGFIGGVGYDISKHWSLQGDVLYTTFDSGSWHSLGVRVSVNFLAF